MVIYRPSFNWRIEKVNRQSTASTLTCQQRFSAADEIKQILIFFSFTQSVGIKCFLFFSRMCNPHKFEKNSNPISFGKNLIFSEYLFSS